MDETDQFGLREMQTASLRLRERRKALASVIWTILAYVNLLAVDALLISKQWFLHHAFSPAFIALLALPALPLGMICFKLYRFWLGHALSEAVVREQGQSN